MTVKKTSILPAPRSIIFAKLTELKTLQYIAKPYATFEPLNAAKDFKWEVGGESSYKFRLFGFVPFGVHTIHIERFDEEYVSSREGNPHVPVWNHEIFLEKQGENRTLYTDRVTIKADWKTFFVWLWANCFYAHRQGRWKKLLVNKRNDI